MCEDCGCQAVPSIEELTREHDVVLDHVRTATLAAGVSDVGSAVQTCAALSRLLGPHTAVEEQALFPPMAREHPAHVATLVGSVKGEELTDRTLPLDDLVWRLLHEEDEVRTLEPVTLSRGCRCSPDYIASVIARFPEEDRAQMIGDDGLIRVDCAFCATSFPIPAATPDPGEKVAIG